METIKNYLESMFRNLPNTSEVLKAKNELLQMMEDKYAELRREGKSENEAVATVISEFGNLDEVASSLGIKEVLGNTKEEQTRRNLSLDEVKEYLADLFNSILFRTIGIMLFISCSIPVIVMGDIVAHETTGVVLLFVFIAAGIACMIIPRTRMESWAFLRSEPCSISPATTDYVSDEKKKFRNTYTILNTLGIVFCVGSFIPSIIFDDYARNINESWGAVLFLGLIALGAGCFIYSNRRYKAYQKLLNINSENTIGGTYTRVRDKEPYYNNKTLRAIMSVYWPTVTCIYLAYSFLTFQWWISWIIWPIASVVRRLIINLNTDD